MWREVLPGVGLMYLFLVIPGVSIAQLNKYFNGGKEKRIGRTEWQWLLMDRDRRVSGTGEYFDSKGLENIN